MIHLFNCLILFLAINIFRINHFISNIVIIKNLRLIIFLMFF